jgi:hypothetical protein
MASTAPIMESIASLEKELARLKTALAESGVQLPSKKEKKPKKERDPDAPPPKANPFFEFLNGRIRPLLNERKAEMKLPGTVAPLFAKHLKESKEGAYSLEDDAIMAAFEEWATPENLTAPPRKAKESDAASEAGSEPKAEKPKRVLSDEQKAKMKEGREKKKAEKDAAKAAEKAAVATETETETEPKKPAAVGPTVAAVAAPPKKSFAKKEVKKERVYSLAELQDWKEIEVEGESLGVNQRGDVINGDGEFQGHWDGKTLNREAPLPADWDTVMA